MSADYQPGNSNETYTPPAGYLPEESAATTAKEAERQKRRIAITASIAIIIILALLGGAVYGLLQPSTPTDKIRDIFIIFMAVETLVIGLVLIILIIQLARLINLLQNEIKPILNSTNESVDTLRGTIIFISDNLAEPIVKLNEYMAAVKQLGEFLRFTKKK